ncbi:calcium-binding protein [Streptosporangium lutulentum]|uniref:Ca2+-binding RTX toxin-like protein n=1 Tax=Streptosporangium lutulentum TaxID=1461250 RepID=A0ABT9QF00_9ACTN|nr:calcium-binding protein [Streptosporangium lutulentum]MDP9844911.1 Ca2+-binding RTX toxin-like protein [Streptosporangium lutulentum]
MRSRSVPTVAALALVTFLALPADASTGAFAPAGTCALAYNNELSYTAEPGVANELTVIKAGQFIHLEDEAGPINGCNAHPNIVGKVSTNTTVVKIRIVLGDEDDIVTVTAPGVPTIIFGGDGNDELAAADGKNDLRGGNGDDELRGSGGPDRLRGDAGDDQLRGHTGDDVLNGGAGEDELRGDAGADELTGGQGIDDLRGGPDNDELNGSGGDDELDGGAGDDALNGGPGDDELTGGPDADDCKGGAGADTTSACE